MTYASFVYEIQTPEGGAPERGEFEARDETVARRRLRGMLGELRLPPNARLYAKSEIERRRADAHSAKLRHLLRVLGEHHAWLEGKGSGRRADLTRLNLAGVGLQGKILKYADMAEVDLSGADLAGVARLQYPPNLRPIRVMCSGMVSPDLVMEAFKTGADGVMVMGCHPGECHYLEGNIKAQARLEGLTHASKIQSKLMRE